MTPTPFPIADIFDSGLAIFLKIIFVLPFLLHAIFTAIVIRQIKLMSATVMGPSCQWLRLASFIYFALGLFLLLLAMLVL